MYLYNLALFQGHLQLIKKIWLATRLSNLFITYTSFSSYKRTQVVCKLHSIISLYMKLTTGIKFQWSHSFVFCKPWPYEGVENA